MFGHYWRRLLPDARAAPAIFQSRPLAHLVLIHPAHVPNWFILKKSPEVGYPTLSRSRQEQSSPEDNHRDAPASALAQQASVPHLADGPRHPVASDINSEKCRHLQAQHGCESAQHRGIEADSPGFY
jgi:hypothetical protein